MKTSVGSPECRVSKPMVPKIHWQIFNKKFFPNTNPKIHENQWTPISIWKLETGWPKIILMFLRKSKRSMEGMNPLDVVKNVTSVCQWKITSIGKLNLFLFKKKEKGGHMFLGSDSQRAVDSEERYQFWSQQRESKIVLQNENVYQNPSINSRVKKYDFATRWKVGHGSFFIASLHENWWKSTLKVIVIEGWNQEQFWTMMNSSMHRNEFELWIWKQNQEGQRLNIQLSWVSIN